MAGRSRGGSLVTIIVVLWLAIGLLAAFQRDYFGGPDKPSCTKVGTIAVTALAGPLNYFGANPKIKCKVPEPSK
jgi:hypothetical protein